MDGVALSTFAVKTSHAAAQRDERISCSISCGDGLGRLIFGEQEVFGAELQSSGLTTKAADKIVSHQGPLLFELSSNQNAKFCFELCESF